MPTRTFRRKSSKPRPFPTGRDTLNLSKSDRNKNAMSDDHSQNNDSPSSKKGFFTLILNQLFHGEPKNRDDLLELIRDSEQNELIDQDTRDMLEGVMDIAEQRVRDIMIRARRW